MTDPAILRIAIPSPLRRLFDYLYPAELGPLPEAGCRVLVPFGRRQLVGIVIGQASSSEVPTDKLKPIAALLDAEPLLSQNLLELGSWAASYYQHPIGDALSSLLPVLLRRGEPLPSNAEPAWQLTTHGKGLPESALSRAPRQQQVLQQLQLRSASRSHFQQLGISSTILRQLEQKGLIEQIELAPEASVDHSNLLAEPSLPLYPEQQQALEQIQLSGFHSYLLDGTTGSGKTEVYLQLIEQVVRNGRQALVMIPEISLTPQTLQRFTSRFNCPVAVIHSGLTDRERALAWDQARTGRAAIVLGTRSAIFTPLKNPGLLIVDEEHDSSFKQQEGFRYSARDLAVWRAQSEQIPLILGSATPSLESLHNCQQTRYTRLVLSSRTGASQLPNWKSVDVRQHRLSAGFSRELIDAMQTQLDDGNQVLVFLNRRGFAPTLSCNQCGWIANCHRCEARLTVHRQINRLICHHCEFQQTVPARCSQCHSVQLQCVGQGTERSEDTLAALFPNFPVIRVDRDTTRRKQAMQEIVAQIHSGEPCILVGTQMLAKGHHFPNVTLVAILDADAGLFSADFRAPEKMGQLITQVAGRAGRGDKPGMVILQSQHCEHPLISTLMHRPYSEFCEMLLTERRLAQLPPFRYMALLRAEARNMTDAENFLAYARQLAEQQVSPNPDISYLGPLPAPMEKRSGRFRQQFSITCRERPRLQQLMSWLCPQLEASSMGKKVRWSVDIDPQDMS